MTPGDVVTTRRGDVIITACTWPGRVCLMEKFSSAKVLPYMDLPRTNVRLLYNSTRITATQIAWI